MLTFFPNRRETYIIFCITQIIYGTYCTLRINYYLVIFKFFENPGGNWFTSTPPSEALSNARRGGGVPFCTSVPCPCVVNCNSVPIFIYLNVSLLLPQRVIILTFHALTILNMQITIRPCLVYKQNIWCYSWMECYESKMYVQMLIMLMNILNARLPSNQHCIIPICLAETTLHYNFIR